jgi:hypothetical protein
MMEIESQHEGQRWRHSALKSLAMMLEYAQAEAEEKNVPTLVFLLKIARQELSLVLESLGGENGTGQRTV